mmetsp:Transcript_5452/g.16167  ORF Transcript_5452/g.16167 Transcript_5452/m.16167 type:complete len:261 (+) Transcript_5452:127-909(+)
MHATGSAISHSKIKDAPVVGDAVGSGDLVGVGGSNHVLLLSGADLGEHLPAILVLLLRTFPLRNSRNLPLSDGLPQRPRLCLCLGADLRGEGLGLGPGGPRAILCQGLGLGHGLCADLPRLGLGTGLQLRGLGQNLCSQGLALLLQFGSGGLDLAAPGLLELAILLALPAELVGPLLLRFLRLLQPRGDLPLCGGLGSALCLHRCLRLGRNLLGLVLELGQPVSLDAGLQVANLHLGPGLDNATLDLSSGLQGLNLRFGL